MVREGGREGSGRLLKSVRGTERLGRRGRGGCEGDLFCSSSSPSAVRRARRLRRALPDTAVTVLHTDTQKATRILEKMQLTLGVCSFSLRTGPRRKPSANSDPPRQLIRKIPIAKIESEYSSTTILQSEYLSTRAVAHGEATA